MAVFRPAEILPAFDELDIDKYVRQGFDTVLLDVDNTIAIPNTGVCDERAEAFIRKLQDAGLKVVIFSNNTQDRVKRFIRDLDVDYVCWALKPLPFSFWKACRKANTSPRKTLALGDQLVTDIIGANLAGCKGIYCRQLQEKDSKLTAFNRHIENFIWRHILHEKV